MPGTVTIVDTLYREIDDALTDAIEHADLAGTDTAYLESVLGRVRAAKREQATQVYTTVHLPTLLAGLAGLAQQPSSPEARLPAILAIIDAFPDADARAKVDQVLPVEGG